MRRRGGFIMIIALVYTMVLAVIVMAMAYFIASETRSVGFLTDDTQALYLAQAGVERAFREIRNEVITPPQTGTADLRGAVASITGTGISNVARIRYIGETTGTATFTATSTGTANLLTFDSNYTQTRIVSVLLFARASRATGGTGATLQVSYSTNGVFPQPGSTALTWALPSTTTLSNNSVNITADRTWTWPTIMGAAFTLRAQRTAGNRAINLDAIWLRVTYDIDTNTEPWYTGTYQAFPVSLGGGVIQSVAITDEARKVHLNTAPQALLNYLMREHTIPAATASTIATNIVNRRDLPVPLTNPFDSVEELQQVTGMTTAYYNLIKDDVTVYSYINPYCYRPSGNRAPININTATREVLEAVFDAVSPALGSSDPASLATDIINNRPFSCFYNYDTGVTRDFYDFVNSRTYLSTTERRVVLDHADPSSLIPATTSYPNTTSTEFCYANTTYKIDSVGRINLWVNPTDPADVKVIDLRAVTVVGNDGSKTFPVYYNQPSADWKGYWKENYE